MYCHVENDAEQAAKELLQEEEQALAKAASKKAKKAVQKAKKQQQQSVLQQTAESAEAAGQADTALPDSSAQQSHSTESLLQHAPPQTPDKHSPLLHLPPHNEPAEQQQAEISPPKGSAATPQHGNGPETGYWGQNQPALQSQCQGKAVVPLPPAAEIQLSQHATASAAVQSAAPHMASPAIGGVQSADRHTGRQSSPRGSKTAESALQTPAEIVSGVPTQLFCCPITQVRPFQMTEPTTSLSVWVVAWRD